MCLFYLVLLIKICLNAFYQSQNFNFLMETAVFPEPDKNNIKDLKYTQIVIKIIQFIF